MPESFLGYDQWLRIDQDEDPDDADLRQCCEQAAILLKMGFSREELFVLTDHKKSLQVVPRKCVPVAS